MGACTDSDSNDSFAVTGAEIHTMDADNTVIQNGVVTVLNGLVACVGTAAQCPTDAITTLIQANSGILIPAFVSALSPIGQQEIAQVILSLLRPFYLFFYLFFLFTFFFTFFSFYLFLSPFPILT